MMGLFVTFEGIDGCGKSTQIKLLHENLIAQGYSTVITREPGGTPISEKIRSIILGIENSEMSNRCELLLYLAARAQHIDEKIIPEKNNGKIVLSDRFEEATFAYQGYGRDLRIEDIHDIQFINNYATSDIRPDITYIFDISPEVSEERFKASGKVRDRMELNNKDFFNRVRKGYLSRAAEHPDRIVVIDGELDIYDIEKKVLDHFLDVIKIKSNSIKQPIDTNTKT